MKPDTLQQVVPWTSVVLAVAAAISLLFGVWSYRRNAEAQLQLSALGSLQHYLDLAVAYPELASRDDDQPIDARYAWFAAQALTTAQTLRVLVGEQDDWERAVNAIVRQHRSYLRSGAFVCDDFSPEFVGYLRERVARLSCVDLGADRP